MQASLCAMRVALEQIDGDDQLLTSAIAQLSLAVASASRYHRLINSIYWKDAKPALKKSMRRSLNFLAYETYSAFLEAISCLERYSEIYSPCESPPSWWNDTVVNLTLAYNALKREHADEINVRQLFLLPDARYIG